MKKKLLLAALAALTCSAYAQTTPTVQLTATPGKQLTLSVKIENPGTTIRIDWGNGEIYSQTTTEQANQFQGEVSGEGQVKFFADGLLEFDCDYEKEGAKISAINVSNATELLKLRCVTHNITTLDISRNTKLTHLYAGGNPGFGTISFENNPDLVLIDINNGINKDGALTGVNLTQNTKLTTLYLQGHKLTQIDLSRNSALSVINLMANQISEITLNATNNPVLKDVRMNDNLLRTLDISTLSTLEYVFCMNNLLSEIKVNTASTKWKRLSISGNKLVFSQLPQLTRLSTYTYAPQDTIVALPAVINIATGETINLSAYNNIADKDGQLQPTTYTWRKGVDTPTPLVINEDYTINNGVTTFLVDNNGVYCEMTTPAFPKFTGNNALKTSVVMVVNEPGASVPSLRNDPLTWSAANGRIDIGNLAGNETIAVYNTIGRRIATIKAQGTQASIAVEKAGIYIVTVDGRARKIAVR